MTSRPLPIRVIKVGGSLLDWPALPLVLTDWLAAQRAGVNILLCGTGRLGDAIRDLDRALSLGAETSHWLCVDALSITARLLAHLLPQAEWISQYQVLQSAMQRRSAAQLVLDAADFLKNHEPGLGGRQLPHNWNVTTDSISARLAEVLPADELIILKSADCAPATSSDELAAAGIVDPYFPTAAQRLRHVRFVNLRKHDQRTTDH